MSADLAARLRQHAVACEESGKYGHVIGGYAAGFREVAKVLREAADVIAALPRWQSIESAPNGSDDRCLDVLVVVEIDERRVVGEARLHEDGWYWANENSGDYHASPIFPILWQPLPAPPSTEQTARPSGANDPNKDAGRGRAPQPEEK